MEKKYELTNTMRLVFNEEREQGAILYQIKALKDFGDVKAGDLGGFIEKEENLSHKGNCWVYDGAIVMGDAKICENAQIEQRAMIYGKAVIDGYATVSDDTTIYASAHVGGHAKVCYHASVHGNAIIAEHACIYGHANISKNTQIKGDALITDHACIAGNVVISGNVLICGTTHITRYASITGKKIIRSNEDLIPIYKSSTPHINKLLNGARDYNQSINVKSLYPNEFTIDDESEIPGAISKFIKEMNVNKKYELTEETKIYDNVILHRIKALKDFGNVKKGDLGGWIEKEENLSQEGDCWVYNDAIVCNDATVTDDAIITDHAWIFRYAKIKDRACISGHAEVMGDALVCDDVSIRDHAVVCGDAIIKNIAVVYGNARIFGVATIEDHACIFGHAEVMGDALVFNHASICDYARVTGKATVSGYATVRDRAVVTGNAKIAGHTIVKDNACVKGNATILDAIIKNDMIVDEHSKIDGDTVIDNTTRLIKASLNNKKYELTDETKTIYNGKTVVHRIKALRDFSDVKKGDLGGFIEGEFNLSHKGNCWAYDGVIVCGRAGLYDNDIIRNTADNGNMTIFDCRKIL